MAKVIAPKKQALNAANEMYQKAMAALEIKRAMLQVAREKVATLEAHLSKENGKLQNLMDEADICTKKLQRAEDLIGGLGGEKTRWFQSAKDLGTNYYLLTGSLFICALI